MTPTALPALPLAGPSAEAPAASPDVGLEFGVHLAAAMPATTDPALAEALAEALAVPEPVDEVRALLLGSPTDPEPAPLVVAAPAAPILLTEVAPPTLPPLPAPAAAAAVAVAPMRLEIEPRPGTGAPAVEEATAPAAKPELFILDEAPPVRLEPATPKLTPIVEAAPPPPPGPPTQAAEPAPQARPAVDPAPVADVDAPEFEIGARIRTAGTKTARVDVPMADGSTVRAEVSVEDGAVEVRLHGSEELGAMAVREAQELRDGLQDQGLDLAEFEFLADADAGDEEAGDGKEGLPSAADGPMEFAPADFDPDAEEAQAVLASATQDPELSRGAFVRRRM